MVAWNKIDWVPIWDRKGMGLGISFQGEDGLHWKCCLLSLIITTGSQSHIQHAQAPMGADKPSVNVLLNCIYTFKGWLTLFSLS